MKDIGLTDSEMQEVIGYLEKNPKISRVILYGSRAKGTYRPFSDVDITLVGNELTLSDVSALEELLYYSYLPYKFDISIFSRLKNQKLIEHIRRVGIVIYES